MDISSVAGSKTDGRNSEGVIGDPCAPYNARSCHAAAWFRHCYMGSPRLPDGNFLAIPSRIAFKDGESKACVIVYAGRMLAPSYLPPLGRVDWRKYCIALRPRVHEGELQSIGKRHGLHKDLGTSDDHDGI